MSEMATKAAKKATTRLCGTCNSTKHHTTQCDKARQTKVLVTSLMTAQFHTLCCVIGTLDRIQLKALLSVMLSHQTELGAVPNVPNKPVSKMTNGQLARHCLAEHRVIQTINREIARAQVKACPICMENLQDGDAQCKLACGHSLHTKCYSNMFAHDCRRNKTAICPLCRQDAY